MPQIFGKPTVVGCDLSHHNPSVDWNNLALEIKFVILKATEGEDYVDPKFLVRWQKAKDAGRQRAAYHFFSPDDYPQDQAEHFTDFWTKSEGLDYGELKAPLWLDVEDSTRPLQASDAADVMACWSEIEQLTGQPCGIYGSHSTLQMLSLKFPDTLPFLWLAHYGEEPGEVPQDWTQGDVLIWQFSQKGSVVGIPGDVDLDVMLAP